jgi:hypothetical protein
MMTTSMALALSPSIRWRSSPYEQAELPIKDGQDSFLTTRNPILLDELSAVLELRAATRYLSQ